MGFVFLAHRYYLFSTLFINLYYIRVKIFCRMVFKFHQIPNMPGLQCFLQFPERKKKFFP